MARWAGVKGEVLARVSIARSGAVVKVQVVSGHLMLIASTQEALSKWRFEALTRPQVLIVKVRFVFKPEESDNPITTVKAILPSEVEVSTNPPISRVQDRP